MPDGHRNTAATKRRDPRKFRQGDDLVAALMAELDKARISERLQTSRVQAGLRQHEMAELMHVHKRSIENWESQKDPTVPYDRLDEWARATNTRKEWLLHGDNMIPSEDVSILRAELEAMKSQLASIEQLLRLLSAAQ
jgi:transcriptional regulator with XRE-family HTH domain